MEYSYKKIAERIATQSYDKIKKERLKKSSSFLIKAFESDFSNWPLENVKEIRRFFDFIDNFNFASFDNNDLFFNLSENIKKLDSPEQWDKKFVNDLILYIEMIKENPQTNQEIPFVPGNIKNILEVRPKFNFEVKCLVHEARILRDYLLEVCENQDKNKPFFIVPNLTYGLIPFTVIKEYLQKNIPNVKFIENIKISSTFADHRDLNEELFQQYEDVIFSEQPTMIVIDGTNHLPDQRSIEYIRYPRSSYGFLNYFIALNGLISSITGEKIENKNINHLSPNEFQIISGSFDRYREHFLSLVKEKEKIKPYRIGLWNTTEKEVIGVDGKTVEAFEPEELEKHPGMIFINVGLYDEDIPDYIKNKFPNLRHEPGYFDFNNTAHLTTEVQIFNSKQELEKVNLLKMAINYEWDRQEDEQKNLDLKEKTFTNYQEI